MKFPKQFLRWNWLRQCLLYSFQPKFSNSPPERTRFTYYISSGWFANQTAPESVRFLCHKKCVQVVPLNGNFRSISTFLNTCTNHLCDGSFYFETTPLLQQSFSFELFIVFWVFFNEQPGLQRCSHCFTRDYNFWFSTTSSHIPLAWHKLFPRPPVSLPRELTLM